MITHRIAAVALMGLFLVLQEGCHEPVSPTTPASSGSAHRIVALGRLEPADGIVKLSVPVGDRLRELKQGLKEGDRVKEREVLAVLQTHDARAADRKLAQSQYKEARKRRQAVTAAADKEIAEATLHLRQLEKLEPLDAAAQKAKVDLLKKALENAKANLERLQQVKRDTIPQQEMDRHQLLAAQAELEWTAAVSQLQKMTEGHQFNLETARAHLATLQAGRKRAREEVPVESARVNVKRAAEAEEQTLIRAPSDGVVLKIFTHPGETIGAHPLLYLANTDTMAAVVEVPQKEIDHIQPAQKAEIFRQGVGDKPLWKGHVIHISGIVGKNKVLDVDPTAEADRRVVEVKLLLDPADCKTAAGFVHLEVRAVFAGEVAR
jgi:HlyD family secretion protein